MTKTLTRFAFLTVSLLWLGADAFAQSDAEAILTKVNALPPKQRTEVLVAEARKEGVIEWYGSLLVPEATLIIDRFKQLYHSWKSSTPEAAGQMSSTDFSPSRRQVLTKLMSSVREATFTPP
jgi:hypothetical protein